MNHKSLHCEDPLAQWIGQLPFHLEIPGSGPRWNTWEKLFYKMDQCVYASWNEMGRLSLRSTVKVDGRRELSFNPHYPFLLHVSIHIKQHFSMLFKDILSLFIPTYMDMTHKHVSSNFQIKREILWKQQDFPLKCISKVSITLVSKLNDWLTSLLRKSLRMSPFLHSQKR